MVSFILSQKESNLISLLSLAGGFPLNFLKDRDMHSSKRTYSLGHIPIKDGHTWHDTKKKRRTIREVIQVIPNYPQLFEIFDATNSFAVSVKKPPDFCLKPQSQNVPMDPWLSLMPFF